MSGFDYDLLVLGGGGSAGFTAATTAMKTGARVAMVEAGRLGGLCILAGCMPSKSLLHDAEAIFRKGADRQAAYPGVLAHKRAVVEYLAGRRAAAVAAKRREGLVLLEGAARFHDPHTVEVNGRRVTARSLVIATGSQWSLPDVPGLGEAGYILGEDLMELPSLPASLVVLGGGAMAVELGQYALRMGVAVTILQRGSHLLSGADPRAGQLLAEALRAEGAQVFTDTKLVRVEGGPGKRRVSFSRQGYTQTVEAEALLVALGRRPRTEDLVLAAAGVQVARGAVAVDRRLRTSQPHIYAAGDVTGVNLVVNLAIVQGEVAGHNATHPDAPREVDDRVLPQAVFCDPQYARVGLTARQLADRGTAFVEASFDLAELGVARTYPRIPAGFMIMRASPADRRILGAEIVAPEASLLIHDTAVAMKLGGTPRDLAELPYVHPCLSELTQSCAFLLDRRLGA